MAAIVDARRIEQRRNWQQPTTAPRKRGSIVVADGYGVHVGVERGQLVLRDGIGRDRDVRRYSRAEGSNLLRLVVLGGSGAITLDAFRWVRDVGASLLCIDRDGRILCTTGPDKSEAKLRRAQALAPNTTVGLEVARFLLTAKLGGQQQLLDRLPCDPYSQRVLRDSLDALGAARTIEEAVSVEAVAAAAYWASWQSVDVRFQPAAKLRLPEQWRRFGSRSSPIGGGPRQAVTAAGAILNYLYALLEAEARLACRQLGLDPSLAVIHADIRGRDSLPLDLMEAIRPSVDRYFHALLTDKVFSTADFHETRRGTCRLLPPLTHQLAETLLAWQQLVAPVAEQVAGLFLRSDGKPMTRPTPLTQTNRRIDRARRHGRTGIATTTRQPRLKRTCKRCGGRLPRRDRVYCDSCLPLYQQDRYQAFLAAGRAHRAQQAAAGVDPSHGGKARELRAANRKQRCVERRQWEATRSDQPADPDWFRKEILPRLQEIPLYVLARSTGLSHSYLSLIRRGVKTPHPRHWLSLQRCFDGSGGEVSACSGQGPDGMDSPSLR
jgi:CRISPR-associated endonuclease Cas1